MDSVDLIRRLHRHRMWVNRKLLNTVKDLSEDQLHQPFAIGQGTIWKSLTHLMAAEYVWLEALQGDECAVMPGDVPERLPGNQEGDDALQSLDALEAFWQTLDKRWQAYLTALSPHELTTTVYKVSSLTGQRSGTSRGDILLHVCTHAQYTTAQLVNMLRQAGHATLPDVMLISLAREQQSATML